MQLKKCNNCSNEWLTVYDKETTCWECDSEELFNKISPEIQNEIDDLIQRGNSTLLAIKTVLQATGATLVDSSNVVYWRIDKLKQKI